MLLRIQRSGLNTCMTKLICKQHRSRLPHPCVYRESYGLLALQQCRSFNLESLFKPKPPTPRHKEDGVPDNIPLAYSCDDMSIVNSCQLAVPTVPIFWGSAAYKLYPYREKLWCDLLNMQEYAVNSIGGCVMVTFLAATLHVVSRKIILRMYYDEKTQQFTAITYTGLFRKRKFNFSLGECKFEDSRLGPFGNALINGRWYSIDFDCFVKPKYLTAIMRPKPTHSKDKTIPK